MYSSCKITTLYQMTILIWIVEDLFSPLSFPFVKWPACFDLDNLAPEREQLKGPIISHHLSICSSNKSGKEKKGHLLITAPTTTILESKH